MTPRFLETLWHDVRYTLRVMRKSPVVTVMIISSLSLGIGANTAIFGLIDAVLLKMLNVNHPEELVVLTWADARGTTAVFPYPTFNRLAQRDHEFSGLFAFAPVTLSLDNGGAPEQVEGQYVSGGYYSVLGVKPALGRFIA